MNVIVKTIVIVFTITFFTTGNCYIFSVFVKKKVLLLPL